MELIYSCVTIEDFAYKTAKELKTSWWNSKALHREAKKASCLLLSCVGNFGGKDWEKGVESGEKARECREKARKGEKRIENSLKTF